MQELRHEFSGRTFSDLSIENFEIASRAFLLGCCFVNCSFHKIVFPLAQLAEVTFIDCSFFGCRISGEGREIYCFECRADGADFIAGLEGRGQGAEERTITSLPESEEFERKVLERFWPPGRAHFGTRRALRTLYLGDGRQHHAEISAAIERLRQRDLILVESSSAVLNVERIREIRSSLGGRL